MACDAFRHCSEQCRDTAETVGRTDDAGSSEKHKAVEKSVNGPIGKDSWN